MKILKILSFIIAIITFSIHGQNINEKEEKQAKNWFDTYLKNKDDNDIIKVAEAIYYGANSLAMKEIDASIKDSATAKNALMALGKQIGVPLQQILDSLKSHYNEIYNYLKQKNLKFKTGSKAGELPPI